MKNEVTITASGPVGCGKSTLLGEIEIMLKAMGVPVRYADEAAAKAEKNGTHAEWTSYIEMYEPSVVLVEQIVRASPSPAVPTMPELTVWEGAMPESNGKSNFTAILRRKGADFFDEAHFTIARSEYPERVRYEADCVRHLIGELPERPFILDYDADKHSGYVAPAATIGAGEGKDALDAAIEEVREGVQILTDLAANIEKHGNYSAGATVEFIGQAKQCFQAIAMRSKTSPGEAG